MSTCQVGLHLGEHLLIVARFNELVQGRNLKGISVKFVLDMSRHTCVEMTLIAKIHSPSLILCTSGDTRCFAVEES